MRFAANVRLTGVVALKHGTKQQYKEPDHEFDTHQKYEKWSLHENDLV